jgi:hypothetical protein
MKIERVFQFILLFLVILLLMSALARATDRCAALVTPVRLEHTKYFGMAFPYWYGVGQLKQESACRDKITAFDAGMGVAQFMPKTSVYIQSLMGEKLDPYNSLHAIRMQAFYMFRIHSKENWSDRLWVSYQIYNGGKGILYQEYTRAGKILDWELMKFSCQRKKITMKWGVLDFCEVNYDYSKKVERYGDQYRKGPDSYSYW